MNMSRKSLKIEFDAQRQNKRNIPLLKIKGKFYILGN